MWFGNIKLVCMWQIQNVPETILILVHSSAFFKMKTHGVKKTSSPHLQQHMLNDIQDAACQPDCITCSHSLKTIVLGVKNHPQAIFFFLTLQNIWTIPITSSCLNQFCYIVCDWLIFFQVSWYTFKRSTPLHPLPSLPYTEQDSCSIPGLSLPAKPYTLVFKGHDFVSFAVGRTSIRVWESAIL